MADHLLCMNCVIDALGWHSLSLMGHSLGSMLATYLAGALGERVQRLCLVEGGFGPPSLPDPVLPLVVRAALAEARLLPTRTQREYRSFADAVQARADSNSQAYGWPMKLESAAALGKRGLQRLDRYSVGEHAEGVVWTHDPRLTGRPVSMLSAGQVLELMAQVKCPLLCLRASHGLPYPQDFAERAGRCPQARFLEVEGGHHVHMDAPELVLPAIELFLQDDTEKLAACTRGTAEMLEVHGDAQSKL